jgi:arginase family enzyme
VHLRILDLDGSLTAQVSLQDVAAWSSVATVPLRDLAPRLRLWSRDATMDQARERLAAYAPAGGTTLTLIGSGDFHHLAVPLFEQTHEPLTLVHFDNHPDWVRWAPRWHCGSWVNQALRLPHVAKVVTLGPNSADLVRPELRAEISPRSTPAASCCSHGSTRRRACSAALPMVQAIASERTHRLAQPGRPQRADNLAAILATIETDAIWLTIDKDVLTKARL